jgi:transposase
MDRQRVKTTGVAGLRGDDAGKKVKGRQRPIRVETLGYRWNGVVHPADRQDRDGAKRLLQALAPMLRLPLLKRWADRGYRGTLLEWGWQHRHILLEIVSPPSTQPGFAVLPKRWSVEPTFAWLGNSRRLSKDYQASIPSSEGMIDLASIHFLLKRLTA